MKMRTQYKLGQVVIWKGSSGVYRGKVVGLHDDFIKVKEIWWDTEYKVMAMSEMVYRIRFENIITSGV